MSDLMAVRRNIGSDVRTNLTSRTAGLVDEFSFPRLEAGGDLVDIRLHVSAVELPIERGSPKYLIGNSALESSKSARMTSRVNVRVSYR